jgi:hypothetical protein
MIKISKLVFLGILPCCITGCLNLERGSPTQFYMEWFKPNVSREETIKALDECFHDIPEHVESSYSDFFKFSIDPADKHANNSPLPPVKYNLDSKVNLYEKGNKCMFKKGFRFKDNLKDPHSVKNTDKIAAKISASKTHINRF